jgi:uncharacterized SAM-binding protein YcdF (DUF218 family)
MQNFIQNQNRKWYARSLKFRIWTVIFCVLFLFVLFQMLFIVAYGRIVECPATYDSFDAVVVFGNKVYPNGQPSPVLKSRLDKAFEITKDDYCNKSGYIIVSGGLGKEGVYEGDAMATYLVGLGMDKEKIIIDNFGNNSYLTAINAKEIASQYGFKSILGVTSYYHVLRTRQALQIAGFEHADSEGSVYIAFQDILKIPRELAGIYVYYFKYELMGR